MRLLARPRPRALLIFCSILLTACAGVPETPRERLAAAEASFAAVLNSLSAARDDGLIKEGAEAKIDAATRTVSAALDAAHAAVRSGSSTAASGWLTVALKGIQALNTELRRIRNE